MSNQITRGKFEIKYNYNQTVKEQKKLMYFS